MNPDRYHDCGHRLRCSGSKKQPAESVKAGIKRYTQEEILRGFRSRPVVEPEDALNHFLPDPMETVRNVMRDVLEKGTEWRTGNPTGAERMAILFLAGVPMRFEDRGEEGMKMVTAVRCGLSFINGVFFVATDDRYGNGQLIRFRPCP